VLALLAAEAHRDAGRLRNLAASDLRGLLAGIERLSHDGVAFSSGVSPHLDRLVALEIEGLPRVESDCRELAPFPAGPSARRRGIWVLSGASYKLERGLKRLGARDDLDVERIGSKIALVTSREALTPRELVTLGLDLRNVWFAGNEPRAVQRVERQEARALAGECPAGD
jgi:hypothetical protein